MKAFALIILLSVCVSCNSKQRNYIKTLQEWYGKEIVFSNNLKAKVFNRDTICDEMFNKKYKVVLHVDSTGCSQCKLQLSHWKIMMEEFEIHNDSLAFFYIVHTKNIRQMAIICKQNKFNHPLFYDINGEMEKLNHFNKNEEFRCFLLDSNNQVIILGNPINNPAIRKLYNKHFISMKE